MSVTTRMHSRGARTLAVAGAATTLVIVGEMIWSRQWLDLLRYSGPLGLFGALLWAALWSPYVECSLSGVRLHNVLRTITLPWPAITAVNGRYGLSLETVYGPFSSWSASRPRLRDNRDDAETAPQPALEVPRLWSELKAAGHLENPRLESSARPWQWRLEVIWGTLVTAAWTISIALFTRNW